MHLREWAALACACASFGALAQIADIDPDWKEGDVPPPPGFKAEQLIPVELDTRGTQLKFGVDPATLSIAPEGIVRYVVVASSTGGATNAMYEGIRCNTAEYRIYARYNVDGGWSKVDEAWRSLQDMAFARHALAIARAGACDGRAPNHNVERIARDLRTPQDRMR